MNTKVAQVNRLLDRVLYNENSISHGMEVVKRTKKAIYCTSTNWRTLDGCVAGKYNVHASSAVNALEEAGLITSEAACDWRRWWDNVNKQATKNHDLGVLANLAEKYGYVVTKK